MGCDARMVSRDIAPFLQRWAGQCRVVTLGSLPKRGKTTSCRMPFPDKPCVTLDGPDNHRFTEEDPRPPAWPRGRGNDAGISHAR